MEKEKEIQIVEKKLGESKFFVMNFKHGEYEENFETPINSYSFWKEAEEQSNRAMFRLKQKNPTLNFDFTLMSMMETKEQHEETLKNHLAKKYPSVDPEKLFEIIDSCIKEIQPTGPDENHPNPFLKFEIGSDFLKVFISSIIEKYNK